MCKVTDAIEAASTCECQRDIHWTDRPISNAFACFGAVVFVLMMSLAVFGLFAMGVR